MGGLYYPLIMQWRLSNSVLICLPEWRAASPDNPNFHINIHKFISLIINYFFMIMSFTNLHCQGSSILPDLEGWILLLEVDNTSTLSYMSILSCMQEYYIVNLCHLFSHIVLYLNTIFPPRFNGQHISGILNVEADALSCYQDHPTYEQIFQNFPRMTSLPDYRVPLTLISAINSRLSRALKKETLSDLTGKLISSKCNSLKIGANNWASNTLL